MRTVGLVWLHQDIRLHDNATISAAAKQCDELAFLYATYDFPAHRGQSYYYQNKGEHRQRFIDESLCDFSHSLHALGNCLHILDNVSLNELTAYIKNTGITDVFYSACADYDHNQRIANVSQRLPNINFHEYTTHTLFQHVPMAILPKVFTQFRQQVEKNAHLLRQQHPFVTLEAPTQLPPPVSALDNSNVYGAERPAPLHGEFIGGERQALLHLDAYFGSQAPSNYKETRNALDTWEHSTKFSAWLAHGNLSVRSILCALRDYEQRVVQNDSTYRIWFELLWREYFYWYAIEHQHKLFTFKGITPCKRMSCFYGERFERWKNGNTPYPIVNACMNQLKQTGYLSNRGRQLAASCFIHELGMDWRYGASYFEQYLIDYDVASNWGNWQYIAGVGADPRGGRQFNLAKQTAQYDPKGEFITAWNGDVGQTRIDSVDAADWPIM